MKTALLLIDLQNDFCTGGALAVEESEQVIVAANQAMAICLKHNISTIASQDWHPAEHMSFAVNSGQKIGDIGLLNGIPQVWWPVHCVQRQHGADFHPQLNKQAIVEIFHKGENPQIDSYSAFFDNGHQNKTRLDGWLQTQQIERLFIIGIATDYCVKFTALDALALGYETWVITDGCRGVNLSPNDSQSAFKELKEQGAILIELAQLEDALL
ncbi:bifunctional nicotinamidase/pyrazinamidase [Photorhabdus laumondii subsp. laumondii]|uniref:Nicotinamidase n=2 Tax=Photorhabdus laumondii TaxID=2218628 RepID=A0A329VK76_9GAMM|nr:MULTISPECIES: bifunctional nicotinamidase/pyrazinamidase [Photorhabdus]PQQ38127.1 bifunctional nicotinamidase/pyrazinamidase [Photorhabdus luminescens]KTL62853.1 nicotinamidase [Photorhabdus laumondii subsp. laumondii]MCC8384531.1 bifunctional nicotinamidase/pyrazinamidase [Photorhabdus laumondii]MCC8412134.1 bifunctional nicotinamidase/pyrazinamidase [Photorhabdus laumondii]NDK93186.1 bifunctional nicotinamidase/pyrazinamidase [Photorhabdus laumondii subsp. laumondii]